MSADKINISKLARANGLEPMQVHNRLNRGWTLEEALKGDRQCSGGVVYCVEHLPSGKKYIGKTLNPLDFRWRNHLAQAKRGSHHAFHPTLKSEGSDSFKIFQIDSMPDKHSLEIAEKYWIFKLETDGPKGFNSNT